MPFFRMVMKLLPQIGQKTNWYSSTGSNSKASLHPGHVKIIELLIFCIVPLPILCLNFLKLKKYLGRLY